jgi:CHAT domain-containing protein
MRFVLGFIRFVLAVPLIVPALRGEVRHVPRDYPRIKSAVLAARDGDVIEADDGYYFEDNIVLDKKIRVKARNPFRAIIYGSSAGTKVDAIFIVRDEVEIEGFILKNGFNGILQRGSPDVAWTARQLAVLNMEGSAISVNDQEANVGRAVISDVIVDNCRAGFETNDAFGIEVKNCLVSNCYYAFFGFNHRYFRVSETMVWGCPDVFYQDPTAVPPPSTSAIEAGPGMLIYDSDMGSQGSQRGVPAGPNGLPEAGLPRAGEWPDENVGRALVLTLAGDVHLRVGDYVRAANFYQNALQVGLRTGSEEVSWRSHAGLARALERSGAPAAALVQYRKAVRVLESLRSKLSSSIFSPGFFSDKMEVYLSLIGLLAERHRETSEPEILEEAFAVAENSRARALLDSLDAASLDLPSSLNPEIRAEERGLYGIISRLQIQLQTRELPVETRAGLLRDLERAETAYRDLLLGIRRTDPAFADQYFPQTCEYGEIREKILEADTAVVEFILGAEHSFAFFAAKNTLSLALLPPQNQVRELVVNYLRFLNLRGTGDFRARKGGQRLNDLLLGAFRSELRKGIRKLIIVPDGPLFYLPFEALVENGGVEKVGKDQGGKTPQFLVENYEISYAPSASALVRLRERKAGNSVKRGILAVAAPRVPPAASLSSGRPYDFPVLKHARREIAAIRHHFPSVHVTVLEDRQAREVALRRLNWKDFRIIHFAVHGVFEEDHWERSGLLLGRDEEAGEDGFFQLRDIFGLKIGSDLVVLSACRSARGSIESGEGLVGLADAFLSAGSRSVLVSHWSIIDQSTAAFMEYFYAALAAGGSATGALREAKIKMIRSEFNHPFYWAAFVLIGDSPPYSPISK